MEQIIKSYLGMFFIVALMSTGFGLLSSAIISRAANNLAMDYTVQLLDSNIAPQTIDKCVAQVRENSEDAYDDLVVTSQTDANGKRTGKMILTYHYTIPFVGINSSKRIIRPLI